MLHSQRHDFQNRSRIVCLRLIGLCLVLWFSVALLLGAEPTSSNAPTSQTLQLGDPAPALQIAKWVKGEPVDLAGGKGKTVYIIEFWATWCPPCRQSIPHLTELQKKYKDKGVVCIGVTSEDPAVVEPFVKDQGSTMTYTVAVDNQGATTKAYMEAFNIGGIPHAFIIDKEGRIAWHTHPMDDDFAPILDKVLANKFDKAAARALQAEREKLIERLARADQIVSAYFSLAILPEKKTEAHEIGNRILKDFGDSANVLNVLAWNILTHEDIAEANRDVDLALQASKKAVELTKNESPGVLDTYAMALFKNGKKVEAIEMVNKAIEKTKNPEAMAEFKKHLAMFQEQPPATPQPK